MSKRHVVLAIALAAAILVIAYDRTRSAKTSDATEATTDVSTSENAELDRVADAAPSTGTMTATIETTDVMTSAPTDTQRLPPSKSSRPIVPVAKLIPSKAKVRAEVEKDPHATPDAVVAFSLGLGERLDQIKNEDEARGFMKELDSCVTGQVQETVTSARTLCLLNAKKVARKYPSLESEYTNLEGRADPNVKSALDLMH